MNWTSIFSRLFKYHSKKLLLSILAFSFVWQVVIGLITVKNEMTHIEQVIKRDIHLVEGAILEKDIEKFKSSLWKVKGDNTQNIFFTPSDEAKTYITPLTVGSLDYYYRFFIMERSFNLVSSGASLGRLTARFDILKILASSFSKDIPLYIVVTIFFFIIFTFSSLDFLRTEQQLETLVSKIGNKSLSGDIKSLRSIIEYELKSPRKGEINEKLMLLTNELCKSLEERSYLDREIEASHIRYEATKRFAHDAISPIHALKVVFENLKEKMTQNQCKTSDMAISTLSNLANNHLHGEGPKNKKDGSKNINMAMDSIVNLKRKEYLESSSISLEYENNTGIKNLKTNIPTDKLFSIISNVVNNSYEAIEGQGKVNILTSSSNSRFVVEISDNGKGIDPEDISKVWEPLFTSGKRRGTGRGLALVKELVEKNWKGSCQVYSRLGEGTKVVLSFPLVLPLQDHSLIH